MSRPVPATLALSLSLVAAAPAQTQGITFPLQAAAGAATHNSPILDLTQTWNGPDFGFPFTAVRIGITDNVSHSSRSRLLEMRVNGGEVFAVRKSGEIVISNPAGTSLGGIKRVGNLGEMALTSQLDSWTGLPAEVIRYGWEGAPGGVAVIRGMGANRLSVESSGAMVFIARNSRYEIEGFGSSTINMIGYQAASANGRPINFTNIGQTAEHATPLYATNVLSQVAAIQEWRDGRSGVETTVAKVDADGAFHAKALTLTDLPTSDPAATGRVWSDGGTLKLSGSSSGPSQPVSYGWDGTPGGDVVLSSSGSGSLSIESPAALILQSGTGQIAFETGVGLPRVDIVGHEDGSSLGVPINFTNAGQDPAQQSHALEVTNVHAGVDEIVRFNDGRSGPAVTVAAVGADGQVMAKGLTLSGVPTTDPAVVGEVWNDGGTLKLSGSSGDSEAVSYQWDGTPGGDAVLSSAGSGSLAIESQAALVLASGAGQIALETSAGAPRVNIVGYEDGSNLGVPVSFTNEGHDPAQKSHALEVTNVHADIETIVEFRDGRALGATADATPVAAIGANGTLFAPTAVLYNLPTSDPMVAGALWSDPADGLLRVSTGI